MATKWSREAVELLIIMYGERPHLFDIKHKDYYNRVIREKALLEISEELKKFDISTDEIRKKIKNIRSQYCKEKQLFEKSKKSGAGTEDLYTPKLWFYDQLNFLQSSTEARRSQSNIEGLDKEMETLIEFEEQINLNPSDCETNSDIESTQDSTVLQKNKGAIRKTKWNLSGAWKIIENIAKKKEKRQKEPCRKSFFTDYLDEELSKIKNCEILQEAQKDIVNIVWEAAKKDKQKSKSLSSELKTSDNSQQILQSLSSKSSNYSSIEEIDHLRERTWSSSTATSSEISRSSISNSLDTYNSSINNKSILPSSKNILQNSALLTPILDILKNSSRQLITKPQLITTISNIPMKRKKKFNEIKFIPISKKSENELQLNKTNKINLSANPSLRNIILTDEEQDYFNNYAENN